MTYEHFECIFSHQERKYGSSRTRLMIWFASDIEFGSYCVDNCCYFNWCVFCQSIPWSSFVFVPTREVYFFKIPSIVVLFCFFVGCHVFSECFMFYIEIALRTWKPCSLSMFQLQSRRARKRMLSVPKTSCGLRNLWWQVQSLVQNVSKDDVTGIAESCIMLVDVRLSSTWSIRKAESWIFIFRKCMSCLILPIHSISKPRTRLPRFLLNDTLKVFEQATGCRTQLIDH